MRRLSLSLVVLLSALAGCRTVEERPTPPPPPAEAAQPAEAPAADQAFRAQQPRPGQAPELVLPAFQKASLPNGLTVLTSTRQELPLVTLQVACAAGAAADTRGKAGLADLSYRMLLEGAGGKDAIALDDAFAELGVSPGVSVGPDGGAVGVTVLKRNADAALALLSDVVMRPNLKPQDFERRKKQQLADLAQKVGSPGYLAQQAAVERVFGKEHPYGHLSSGTPQSVGSLKLADVKGFVQRQLGPRACALVVTGDATQQEAQAWAQKHLGAWKGRATPVKAPPAPQATPRQGVVLVPKAGLNQTVVVMGRPAIAAGDPVEAPLELATTVFGGFFGSRLNMNLREKHGYTYGAGAGMDARKGVGPLTASSAVRADVTGPALQQFMSELKGITAHPITATELEEAREGVIRSVPGGFETVEGLAGTAASLFYEDQPLDRLQQLVKGLETADLAAVQQAAQTYLQPGLLRIVLVGDPQTVKQQVAPLELGPLEEAAPPAAR